MGVPTSTRAPSANKRDSTSSAWLPDKSAVMVYSTFASKVPSWLQRKSPTEAVARVRSVRPPGLETSMETCFTSRPPDKASSMLLTEATVPSNCSPVSSNMIRAVLPTAI